MKKPLFTAAMISALMACSIPMTSHASEIKLLKKGNGYAVFVGQESESLSQVIKDIYENLDSNHIFCPEIPAAPEQPGTQEPETPNIPAPEIPAQPGTQEPDTSVQPDTQVPDTPALPDNPNPDAPALSDTPKPELPALPDTPKPETPSQPDIQEPDAEAPEEDVHPYVIQILNLVNAERAKAGLAALDLDTSVTAAANVRAKEIKQSFSHTRPDGSSFSSALTEQGVSYRRSGENIAWGQKTPEQVMNGWMNSDGHRANILNANFKNIGIGYYQDINGVNYWVQLFTA